MSVKMAVAKYFLHHNRNKKPDYFPSPSFKLILVIFVLSLLALAVTVADGEGDASGQDENSSNIKTELSSSSSHTPLLTVTQGSSQTITTSTVRPWPSHNFFKSVLSKSDNVVGPGSSGSGGSKSKETKLSRPNFMPSDHNHEYKAGGQHKGASSPSQLKRSQKSRKRNKNLNPTDSNGKVNQTQFGGSYDAMRRTSKGRLKNSNETEQLILKGISEESAPENVTQIQNDGNGIANRDKARSSVAKAIIIANSAKSNSKEEDATTPNANSNRKFNTGLSQENGNVQIHSRSQVESKQNENVILSRSSQPILNGSNNKMDESTLMNSQQFGFQYEIEFPPPTFSSRPTPSSLSSTSPSPNAPDFMSTSLLYNPSTIAVSTTFQVFPNSSGRPNKSDTTSAIWSSTTVRTWPANDDAPYEKATTPSPLAQSQSYNGMKGEKSTSTVKAGFPSTNSYSSHYYYYLKSNKSNEKLHYLHSHPTRTPTQTSQLNPYLDDGEHSFQRPIYPQIYPAKSGNEIRTGTTERLSSSSPSAAMSSMKINHNFGNFPSTIPWREFTTMASPLTPTPTMKRGRGGNSSSVNGLTLEEELAGRNNTSVWAYNQNQHRPISHLWNKSQPTHFSQTMNLENMNTFPVKGDDDDVHYGTNQKLSRRGSQKTSLINRKNMFTVVNKAKKEPSLHVESRNATKPPLPDKNSAKPQQYLSATHFHDRTNQVERPPPPPVLTTAILAGPDLFGSNYMKLGQEDNDYFDEDDAQANLHHWIQSEQGHFVSGSTELPRFTNLTWPYYFPANGSSSFPSSASTNSSAFHGGLMSPVNTAPANTVRTGIIATASPSTALAVSFNNSPQRQDKVPPPSTDFNSRYEFYIPSAAADPLQNPILIAKLPSTPNKTGMPLELDSWSRVPTLRPFTTQSHHPLPLESGSGSLKQSISSENDSKSKVKQSHWGSKGVSIKQERPQTKEKPLFPSSSTPPPAPPKMRPPGPQENIKVYESSTGSPKSTPYAPSSTYFPNLPISPSPPTFSTFGGNGGGSNGKHENHFPTFHIPSPSTTWPILGANANVGGGTADRAETVSFVTAKTPTNIWYKPIINHFTATVPFNGTTLFYDSLYHSAKIPGLTPSATPLPFVSSTASMRPADYVGVGGANIYSNNKNDKTLYTAHSSKEEQTSSSTPVLFKVWKLIDGKLTLESQKEIPSWALDGYSMPATGTILNLPQIPPALQPLVTSAMGKEAEVSENGNGKEYIWQRLPVIPSSLGTSSSNAPTESNQQNVFSGSGSGSSNSMFPLNDFGSGSGGGTKRPISINYVLWNNPGGSVYDQSIILSTSTPPPPSPHQFLLSHKPTPVSYFPSSTITLEEDEQELQKYTYSATTPFPAVTVKRPHSYLTGKPSSTPPTTPTTIIPTAATLTMGNEELELLFQNYFQYVITTPTPAHSIPTAAAIPKEPLFGGVESQKVNSTQTKAWTDLKKLILRLAANGNKNKRIGDKTSITQEDQPGEYLDHLGNVAAIALIMNYLQSQEGSKDPTAVVVPATSTITQQQHQQPISPIISITKTSSMTSSASPMVPYGVTDDMTPPHKDQLWATTYPLFQHMLNNPNYTFIPPPPKQPTYYPLSSSDSTLSPTPIPFTEPPTTGEEGTTSNSMTDYYTKFNHYANYPTGSASSITRAPYNIGSQAYITEVPKHGATTQKAPRQDIDKYGDLGYSDDDPAKTLLLPIPPRRMIELLILKKLLEGKKGGGGGGGGHKKKKKGLVSAAVAGAAGATILKKIGHIMKKPSKYWLDLKFDIDFYDLLRKQFLYWLAYRYMPVFIVLAFGLIPITLSFVPLLYKALWGSRKPKYIKVPVEIPKPYPVPIPKPYPVPVFKQPPIPIYPHFPDTHFGHGYGNYGDGGDFYSPPDDGLSSLNDPDLPYEFDGEQEDHQHNHEDDGDEIIHIGSHIPTSPNGLDHYYNAADATGKAGMADNMVAQTSPKTTRLNGYRDNYRKRRVNSFNYNGSHNPSQSPNAFYRHPPSHLKGKAGGKDQEIHVHIHDEETKNMPQYQPYHQQEFPVTFPPSAQYTSYASKDLQPYPVTKSYEVGFDLGQILTQITNKRDMEIFKMLIEHKKANINRLLEMWNLAKYGVGVASSAASTLADSIAEVAAEASSGGGGGGTATTPLYSHSPPYRGKYYGKRGRRRNRRRKKRKPFNGNYNNGNSSNSTSADVISGKSTDIVKDNDDDKMTF